MRSQGLCTKDVEISYFDELMDEDLSDNENDDEDGIPFIPLSRDDKLRIRAV